MISIFERRSALFSADRRYRNMLRIVWDESKPLIAFVGVNPSTADEFGDDPTIVRCKEFARLWGYGGILMLNLFAFMATDPLQMLTADDPVGPISDVGLELRLLDPNVVVVCWGRHGRHRDRGAEVAKQIAKYFSGTRLMCLGTNGDGSPKHPLYLAASTPLQEFEVTA